MPPSQEKTVGLENQDLGDRYHDGITQEIFAQGASKGKEPAISGNSPANRTKQEDARAQKAENLIHDAEASHWLNGEQLSVLEELKGLRYPFLPIYGPPGTGKSKLLATIAAVLTASEHKILITSVSDNIVDSLTQKVWQEIDRNAARNQKIGYTRPSIIRLREVRWKSQSMSQTDTEQSQDGATDETDNDNFDDTFMRNMLRTMQRLGIDDVLVDLRNAKAAGILQQYEAVKQGLFIQDQDVHQTSLPVETTLAWHVEKLLNEFNEAYHKVGAVRFQQRGGSPRGKQWVDSYTDLRRRHQDGSLTGDQRKEYRRLHGMFQETAIARADIMFTMNYTAGSNLAAAFRATFLLQDNANRANFAAAIIPLTCFKNIEGSILFGDQQQMNASSMVGMPNEFSKTYAMSLFGLLLKRRFPGIMLKVQYRMHNEICEWLSKYFYSGLLLSAPSRMQDTDTTRTVREISKSKFNIKGPNGQGACYFGIDIRLSHHVRPQRFDIIRNDAHVKCAADLVALLYDRGIKPSQVYYLALYNGQEAKISAACELLKIAPPGDIGSVDDDRDAEGAIVILDTVVGSCLKGKEAPDSQNLTASERKPERLNVGISRASDACIVLVNGDYIFDKAPRTALAAVVVDMQERKILAIDTKHRDDDEKNEELRKVHRRKFEVPCDRMSSQARLKYLKPFVRPLEYPGIDITSDVDSDA